MTRSQRRRAQRLRAAELLAAGILPARPSHFTRSEVVQEFIAAAIAHRPVRVSWRTVASKEPRPPRRARVWIPPETPIADPPPEGTWLSDSTAPEGWTSYQEGAR